MTFFFCFSFLLGQGSFATVFRCKNKTTNEEYAVKKIEKKKLTKDDDIALRNEVGVVVFSCYFVSGDAKCVGVNVK